MCLSRKKWIVSECDKDLAATLAENCGVEPFAALLLCARGMTDEFEVESFLYDTDLSDPFLLPDMQKAVERILCALENGEKITVFGDYDADGVTSTALMYSYLSSRGANVDYYIPDRDSEGYGMNTGALDILKERGTSLVITVDNGISAVNEIEYAAQLNIDVVVTDHHIPGDILPSAAAVVDPHRTDFVSDFSDWAGVGVAFKVICALDGTDGYELLEKYGDIVAVGTVADIVSLKGENRIIVRSGVAFINAAVSDGTLRKGLRALIETSGGEKTDASSLAFRIAPRINAAGRMGSAERAVKLLLTDDETEAKSLAEEVSSANTLRQSTELQIADAAVDFVESNPDIKHRRVIVVEGDEWHRGVIGIVASRLTDKYGKPCIVISKSGGTAKGSGRSIGDFSLFDALSYCSDVLERFGGHKSAAGLTVATDKISAFRDKINEYAAISEPPVPVINIDCKLNPAALSTDMVSSLEILEPFGADNPAPVFGLYNMEITAVQPVGSGKHMRITVRRKNNSLTVIMFSVTPGDFPFNIGDKVDLAVKLGTSEFRGKTQLSVQVKAIKFSGSDDDAVIGSMVDYDDFCAGVNLSESARENICVDRDFCGKIYKFVKNYGGWNFSSEVLCKRLGLSENKIAACQTALDIFNELGVLEYNNGKYKLPETGVKSALENSEIFKRAAK